MGRQDTRQDIRVDTRQDKKNRRENKEKYFFSKKTTYFVKNKALVDDKNHCKQ